MPQEARRRSIVMALFIFYVGTRWHWSCLTGCHVCLPIPVGICCRVLCRRKSKGVGERVVAGRGTARGEEQPNCVCRSLHIQRCTHCVLLLCTKLSTSNYNLISRRGKSIFSCPECPHLCWGPPSLRRGGGGGGVLCPGCDVYQSPPCRTDTD